MAVLQDKTVMLETWSQVHLRPPSLDLRLFLLLEEADCVLSRLTGGDSVIAMQVRTGWWV